MKQTNIIMGMPITVEVVKGRADILKRVFDYFRSVDARFSTYKKTSEISQVNAGLAREKWSKEMRQVMDLCEQTKQETKGYFDISRHGKLDPSGLVKGWAIRNAAKIIEDAGYQDYFVEAGGDTEMRGNSADGRPWRLGIRNPFSINEIIKVLQPGNGGVATSGTYIRGQHIYNPHGTHEPGKAVVSLSVIGPNIYEADRFATAAFAMGPIGIAFIEQLDGFEGYMVDTNMHATYTSGFERYVATPA